MRRSLLRLLAGLAVLAASAVFALRAEAAAPPVEYVDRVTNLFSQHHWSKGKEVLDEALEAYPNEANLHYLAGRYWWNAKNYDMSRYHLVKACQINYNHTEAKMLLVNVEEITENYSSAVCYVNEMLEISPYSKTLWLRKVDLYKKLGNIQEANDLLRRLSVIYPSDAAVSAEYYAVLESSYFQARSAGDSSRSEENLREMVRINPNNPEYQLLYANELIQKGRLNDALDALTAALNSNPGNVEIIRKTASILMDTGRSQGALTLVKTQMTQHPSPDLTELYNQLLSASARMSLESDPYHIYAKVYAREHSMEALQFLLSEAIRCGYYEDALTHITEMRRRTGDQARWYMLEYDVYNRMGRPGQARSVIRRAVRLFPDDYDVNFAACRDYMDVAREEMADEHWTEAIDALEYVRTHTSEEEIRQDAVRRLFRCYLQTRQYEQGEAMLRERTAFDTPYALSLDRAAMLQREGKVEKALDLLYAAYATETYPEGREALRSAFQETAMPYLREQREAGAHPRVVAVCDILLEMNPRDYWALRYAIPAAEHPEYYIDDGIRFYPGDPYFRLKKAQLLDAAGDYAEARRVLDPVRKDYPGDEALQGAYAGILGSQGRDYRKAGDLDRAARLLDSALVLRPDDVDLRYERGLIYQRRRQWDSAFFYQSSYRPSVLEEKEYIARMEALRNRTYRIAADAGVDLFRYNDNDKRLAIATAGYSHQWKRTSLGMRVNYTARDAAWDSEKAEYASYGGRGVQLLGQLSHDVSQRWSANASFGWADRYFPQWNLDASLVYHFRNDWDAEAGAVYRYLRDSRSMEGLFLQGVKTTDHFYLSAKLTSGLLDDLVFVNFSGRVRFFPIAGGRTYVEAQAGLGSAPELTFFNYYTTTAYNQFNSFVSFGGRYAFNDRLALSLGGTWNTLYNQRANVNYRNLFILNVSLAIAF